MVDPNAPVVEYSCNIEFDGETDVRQGNILLSEIGDLQVQFDENIASPPNMDDLRAWNQLSGIGPDKTDVTIEKAHTKADSSLWPNKVILSKNSDYAPGDDTEVTVDFDVLCFQPYIPAMDQHDENVREQVQDQTGSTVSEEREFQYIETDRMRIYGVPLSDTKDRVDFVKEEKEPIRTTKIRVKEQSKGSIEHRVANSQTEVQKILEVSQLVQETVPRCIRTRVVEVDGTPIDELDYHFERFTTGATSEVGGRFVQFPNKVVWGDFPEYLQVAYDNYSPRVRNDLRLRQVLNYYVDARAPGRIVESRLLSACSAIELLSLWHAREDECSEATSEKIQHTIKKLNVETEGLAQDVVPDPSQLQHPEYFWKNARNYVVHGTHQMEGQEVVEVYERVLIVLKRMISNQLLEGEESSFERFHQMEPRESVVYED